MRLNPLRFLTHPIPCCALLAVTIAAPAMAAEVDSGEQASAPDEAGNAAAKAVERVVVTANRSPTDVEKVGQS